MKKISQSDLARAKKKGKVRRKMGAQPETKKPETVAAVEEGMSGSDLTEQPSPASINEVNVDMQPMAAMAQSMAYRDELLAQLVQQNQSTIDAFKVELALRKPKVGVGYRHKINRDSKSNLIQEVISTPLES